MTPTPTPTVESYASSGTSETVWRIDASGPATTVRSSLLDPAGSRLSFTATSGAVAWTLYDVLGSTAALVAASGATALADAYRYDGYGQAVGSASTVTGGNPFRFRGLLDLGSDASPLYEMGARLYAPSLGTFTQLDTYPGDAADPASMNRFLYAHANPTSLVDPTGHCVTMGCGVGNIDDPGTLVTQGTTNPQKVKTGKKDDNKSTTSPTTSPTTKAVVVNPYPNATADVAAPAPPSPAAMGGCPPGRDCAWEELPSADETAAIVAEAVASQPAGGGFDLFHAVLDGVGMLPVIGTGADLLNAAVYAAQGDWTNAGLSAASAIPLAGDALGAAKIALKYGDDAINVATTVVAHADEAAAAVTTALKGSDEAAGVAGAATKSGTTVLDNKKNGDDFADLIASRYPGSRREVTLDAASGPRREDIVTGANHGIETKTGRTSLDGRTSQELLRDAELLIGGKIDSMEWVFGRSPTTGRIGPTKPLATALDEIGIPWRLEP